MIPFLIILTSHHFQMNSMSSVVLSIFTSIFSPLSGLWVWTSVPTCGDNSALLPERLGWTVPFLLCAVLLWSRSWLNDRITITQDSYFHGRIFRCQPACPSLSLPQFVNLCLLLFRRLLSTQHSMSLIHSICGNRLRVNQFKKQTVPYLLR